MQQSADMDHKSFGFRFPRMFWGHLEIPLVNNMQFLHTDLLVPPLLLRFRSRSCFISTAYILQVPNQVDPRTRSDRIWRMFDAPASKLSYSECRHLAIYNRGSPKQNRTMNTFGGSNMIWLVNTTLFFLSSNWLNKIPPRRFDACGAKADIMIWRRQDPALEISQ